MICYVGAMVVTEVVYLVTNTNGKGVKNVVKILVTN